MTAAKNEFPPYNRLRIKGQPTRDNFGDLWSANYEIMIRRVVD